MLDDAGVIVVSRPAGGYRDGARSYWIEVDGVRVGKLRRGEEAEYVVAPGAHNVRATIDWAGSPTVPVEVSVGNPVHLTVKPGGSAFQPWQLFKREGYLKLSID